MQQSRASFATAAQPTMGAVHPNASHIVKAVVKAQYKDAMLSYAEQVKTWRIALSDKPQSKSFEREDALANEYDLNDDRKLAILLILDYYAYSPTELGLTFADREQLRRVFAPDNPKHAIYQEIFKKMRDSKGARPSLEALGIKTP